MNRIFVLFEILLPYGQWAFGESRVQKKYPCEQNIRVIRDIRVQNIISGLKNIISVQNIAIASAASAASAAIVSAMLMFSFLITFSVS